MEQDNYYDVGKCYKKDGKWHVEKGQCVSGNDGYIFKSMNNYNKEDNLLPVYQAEHQDGTDNYYTRKDFEDLAGELAIVLFEEVDWQHPKSRLLEYEEFDEIDECPFGGDHTDCGSCAYGVDYQWSEKLKDCVEIPETKTIRLTSNQSNKLNWGNKIRVVRNGQVYYIENTKWGVYVTDMGGVPYENVKVVDYWGNELK